MSLVIRKFTCLSYCSHLAVALPPTVLMYVEDVKILSEFNFINYAMLIINCPPPLVWSTNPLLLRNSRSLAKLPLLRLLCYTVRTFKLFIRQICLSLIYELVTLWIQSRFWYHLIPFSYLHSFHANFEHYKLPTTMSGKSLRI